ncbi:uncharacterized protein PgNI_03928 [Pyricularia grisea]|uniref:Uncharacterized protein n=1 Tax=Pyricularia grisea TaxID=148305 RepID=A0A6P8BBN9_PYRGI|nr:uncharacterized protein PgNI_03928 [Pyricularia grisea]TLD13245.1 hypothetical protein PgNI_03928 [Pyricularia grisea]
MGTTLSTQVVCKQLSCCGDKFRMVTVARPGQSNGPLVCKVCGRGVAMPEKMKREQTSSYTIASIFSLCCVD